MPTYKAIASTTVGSGGASSITFSSIPQTYTDLVLHLSGRTSNSATYSYNNILFNGTNANTGRALYGDPSYQVGSAVTVDFIQDGNTATTNTFSSMYFYIPNYTSSTNKSFSADNVMEGNYASIQLQIWAFLSTVTSAITSITLQNNAGANWVQYATATLYGIKNS